MRTPGYFAVILSAFLCGDVLAQTPPVTPPDYHKEPLIFEHFDTTVRMNADGTGERTLHVVVRLQSEGAAHEFSVIQVGFASTYGTGTIDYMRVHKPDGATVETPVSDAIELPAPVTAAAPLYSDLKTRQLPVRSLSAGDVIEYQLRNVYTKAEVPGQFWGAQHFLTEAGVVLSETLTLEIPANTYVQVWNPNHPATPKQHDGVRTYVWNTAQLIPTGTTADKDNKSDAKGTAGKIKDPDEDDEGRKLPSVAWTTFHNWADVGNWYRDLALSRSAPTPAIISRANELTKNAKTPEEQIRALYDFVSARTRYVGIDFGVGRYQPHAADDVMAYQYGDCKDKDTLFEALLRAKGFTTAPALIGVNITPVPDLPSPALFNHVITTVELPTGRIWLDTTPEVAPYRVLVPQIRDQLALVVPPTGVAKLERTPAAPPYPYVEHFEATATLDKDGLLKSHMDLTLRSDSELGFRVLVQRAAPAQWDEAMQTVSSAMGYQGTVSNADLLQKDPAGPVRIRWDYTRPGFADWDHHRILPLFPVLEITYIGKEKAPEYNIDQGEPRRLEAVTRFSLPDGFTPTLPDNVHVKRDYATFDETYRVEKDELIVERTAVILKKKVPKEDWKDYYAYTKALGAESGETYISLNDPGDPPPMPESMKKVGEAMRRGQWDESRRLLNEAKAKDPKTPYLMSLFGYLAQHDNKPDEAIDDYLLEVTNYPNSTIDIITRTAYAYSFQKRYQEAETLLRKYQDRADPVLYSALAYIQRKAGKNPAALETMQIAAAKFPEDAYLERGLAVALHRAHRDDEAAAILKKNLLRAHTPYDLNENAYMLSLTKQELPSAESSSRRAIDMLETDLATVTIDQADDQRFDQSDLLAASWDTLGWILFQEGKPADAEPYIRASWVNTPNIAVASHLAQVLEALGKPSDALTMNDLALGTNDAKRNTEESAEVKKNAERLRKAGATSKVHDAVQELQQIRTFHVDKPAGTTGSATFHIEIAENRIADANLVSGPPELGALGTKLSALKLPQALPPGSNAHLFRDGILFCSAGTTSCEFVLSPHRFGQQPTESATN